MTDDPNKAAYEAKPWLKWYLEGVPLEDTCGSDGIQTLFNNSLYIKDIGLDHEGKYTCEAYNGVGEPQTLDTTITLFGKFKHPTML